MIGRKDKRVLPGHPFEPPAIQKCYDIGHSKIHISAYFNSPQNLPKNKAALLENRTRVRPAFFLISWCHAPGGVWRFILSKRIAIHYLRRRFFISGANCGKGDRYALKLLMALYVVKIFITYSSNKFKRNLLSGRVLFDQIRTRPPRSNKLAFIIRYANIIQNSINKLDYSNIPGFQCGLTHTPIWR